MNLYNFANTIRTKSVLLGGVRRYHFTKSKDGRGSHIKSRKWGVGMARRFAEPLERDKFEDLIEPQLVPLKKQNAELMLDFDGVSSNFTRQFISTILDQFARSPHIRQLAREQKIAHRIFEKSFQSFRLHCCSSEDHIKSMEPELKIVFSDIQNQEQSVDSLYPYFVKHAHKVFPHLECLDQLQQISDLTKPHNWYPEARSIHRKVIFHAGPTNSGKTYEALQILKEANTGMYCGPLRLLAYEIYERLNNEGVDCDLLTGELKLFANDAENPASHCAYTVEMVSPNDRRNVCVIDEIQMLRDNQRGAAWTKALLGAAVDELHLCGEESAISIVERLLDPIGEHVDIHRYERKGDLVVINTHGLERLANIQDGDCIVYFNKPAIFKSARILKKEHGRNAALIFGDLPPETKKAQMNRFNDPNDPTKVLLATDAIGMGMNLNIKRIIFSQLKMANGNVYPPYFIKQIAGRAGRFKSRYCTGEVMALNSMDVPLLEQLMKAPIEDIEKAGIAPNYDMIEMFSLHLPHCSLVELIDIFISIAKITDDFFVCDSQIRETAMLIDHIPLSLRDRWIFSICPVSSGNNPFLNSAYIKIITRYSQGNSITIDFINKIIGPLMKKANNLQNMQTLVEIYDILYAYLWLSYKFSNFFVHRDAVRELQSQCAELINESIKCILELNETWEKKRATSTAKMESIRNANQEPIRKIELKRTRSREADHKLAYKMIKEKMASYMKKKRTSEIANSDADKNYKSLLLEIMTKKKSLRDIVTPKEEEESEKLKEEEVEVSENPEEEEVN